MKRILLFCLIALTTLACQQVDHVTPTDTCQLAQFVDQDETNEFTYNQAGKLSQWVATFDLQGGGKFTQTFVFTYDPVGQVSTRLQTITIDGKLQGKPGKTQYAYTNELLTSAQTIYELPTSTRVISTSYTYDANQRISQSVSTEPGFSQLSTYEYDSRGNCIRSVYSASDGSKNELLYTYDTNKNPLQLLAKSMPFNLRTGRPWPLNAVLTTKETYVDPTAGTDTYTSNRTDLKTDVRGYVSNYTLTYNDGYVSRTTYSLTGCQ